MEKPPVAVASTKRSTPHHPATPSTVAANMAGGSTRRTDMGASFRFFRAYPGGLYPGTTGSYPCTLFSSRHTSMEYISGGRASGFSLRPDWLFPVVQSS